MLVNLSRGRPRRAALIGLVALLAGCSAFKAQSAEKSALQNVGFSGVGVSFQSSTIPDAPDVIVSYTRGPTGQDIADDRAAARVVWTTLPYRFRRVALLHRKGGCVGPVCATSQSGESASYSELLAAFGPRLAELDRRSVAAEMHHDGMVALAVLVPLGLVGVGVIGLVIVVVIKARRKKVTNLPSGGFAPVGWQPYPVQPPPPPPGWPPQPLQ